MKDKKNIERLFQEKFKDFEANPPEHLWDRIDTSLHAKNSKNRKVIPFWWQLGGAAAAIVTLFLLGNLFFSSSEVVIPAQNKVTEKEAPQTEDLNNAIPETSSEDAVVNTNASEETKSDVIGISNETGKTSEDNYNATTSEEKRITNSTNTQIANVADKTPKESPKSSEKISGENLGNTIEVEENAVANLNNEASEKEKSIVQETPKETFNNTNAVAVAEEKDKTFEKEIDDTSDKPSIYDVIEEMDKEEEMVAVANEKSSKWAVSPNVAPVYYNSLSEGSPISRDFSENTKEGNVNMSYGINVAYNVSKRLSIRSGLNSVNMGYSTNDIEFAPVAASSTFGNNKQLSNITFKSPDNTIRVTNSKVPSFNDMTEFESKTENISQGSINQKLGYLEVPMELKYRLVDKKFGVNVIGGFSSLFLTTNEVLLETNNLSNEVGEANNVNDVSFSTNVGIGVDYQLSNSFLLNLEPMFKYQLNTFSKEDGGFSPYLLGVYTGISFKF
ncbi:outer membrane beta-barrel protein [Galbibacter mesophilus]|uniref:outer membrane beta-barrel protein n=1 Tax=Galbibacter mesophilus TaxID=379069 RepID=UPI00191D3C69|nr:hypothetical protein [Galbibacter mesophilus]MCM5662239.1 hypothetical protein [Galbibacter mesophilus]